MRVIPVIDVLNGVVVHARRGRRERYRPLKSALCEGSDPVRVAEAFRSVFGFGELYLADLDAITRGTLNPALIREVSEVRGVRFMVDAGVDSLQVARVLVESGASRVVVGTETLRAVADLEGILRGLGEDRVTVSIDSVEGLVISRCGDLAGLRPWEAARMAESVGVGELIVLELSRVGSGRGVDVASIRRVIDAVAVPVVAGGGVRDVRDVLTLRDVGASGVLVATALHEGAITREDLRLVEGELGA